MPYIGTCFRFYTQMRVQKKKHLHIEFIVTSHNSVTWLHGSVAGSSVVLAGTAEMRVCRIERQRCNQMAMPLDSSLIPTVVSQMWLKLEALGICSLSANKGCRRIITE